MTTHYDIIPDIHADMDRLTQTLLSLGYVADHAVWAHPEGRIAAFLGDFIDMGRANRSVLNLVRAMCDQGSAVAIMGNHELNALLYHQPGLNADGTDDGFMRAHSGKNMAQHQTFLDEFPVPAAYLRQLPAPLAGINLQYGLTNHRAEQIKTLETGDGRTELRAVTGPDYGRIYDHELVSAVQRIAGNGTGDTRWKVPGVLDWSTGIYSPRVDITKDTTTLYASDRDVFLFLVDDLNPIETGLLPDGSPDLYFRGFYCWNSEVGAKTLGIASFYLRAVCQNRNLWGVEDFQEIKIRHSKYAASRFAHEAAPALTRFAESSPAPFIDGIRASREKIVARTDEDRQDFLRKRGFSKAESGHIVETVLAEEGRPPESVFDFVQGITAVARSKPQQDARLVMEGKAKALLEKAR